MRQADDGRWASRTGFAPLRAALFLLALVCVGQVAAQDSGKQPSDAQQTGQSIAAAPDQPAPEMNPQRDATPPGAPAQLPEDQARPKASAKEQRDADLYVFKAEVQEVVLHATVFDEHRRLVTNLGREAFKIFDDGRPQSIHSFRRDDIPVALAIVIDNSGSMRDKRAAVNAAALNLVRASNPQDQVCVVNFSNEYYLDQDYTGDIGQLNEALEHIESRGGTALYDALVATGDHLMRSAKLQKRVILVVTDGEDTASSKTLEQAVRAVAVDGGPVVYGIGILGHDRGEKKARRALRILAEQTGGVAFFPAGVGEVEAISQQIAHDIRNQYTIGYKPSLGNPSSKKDDDEAAKLGGYHKVVVKAEARGYKGLSVRTRSGYYLKDLQPSLGKQ